ncbi:hypothetical protein BD779DRAFT_1680931 [Infundibulicybe gibba]|nr:hypothetical protein BD779DRAFT_1680931 [Infundibulicybe gibba]
MPRYQFPIAITLLPLHLDDTTGPLFAGDPFDVTTPEDIIDGYPTEAEAFWAQMRWRKLFIGLLLFAIVSINMILFGLSLAVSGTLYDLSTYEMHTGVSMYLLVLATRSIPGAPPPVAASAESSSPVYAFSRASLWFPPEWIYSEKTKSTATNTDRENVCGLLSEVGDLPVVPGDMHATFNFASMRRAMREIHLRIGSWFPWPGSGWGLGYRLLRLNIMPFTAGLFLAAAAAFLFYVPALFLRAFIVYLEVGRNREDTGWGWVYIVGLSGAAAITYLVIGQMLSLSTTTIQVRLRIQLNTTLFAKMLVRKDVASSAAPLVGPVSGETSESPNANRGSESKSKEDEFSSKAQVMTLMTTDVDRVSEIAEHVFSLWASEILALHCITGHHSWHPDSPVEIVIGTTFLYRLLGVPCFFGLAIAGLFPPMNHFAGKIVMRAQESLMKIRDERVSLMNELLGGIRMLKFMAWKRSFEAKVLKIRDEELKYQKSITPSRRSGLASGGVLVFYWENQLTLNRQASPLLVTVVSFWHFTVMRNQILTPSIAFTAIIEMKFALSALPEVFTNILQSLVSLCRIEGYLNGAEVKPVPPIDQQSKVIGFHSCTVAWPQDRSLFSANLSTAASTPRHKFVLVDLNLNFPPGELSLICGWLGSGETLLLLALLGEADLLAGQMLCPQSPPDSLASFVYNGKVSSVAWLRNASIKENILFNLPLDEERYQRTLEVYALVNDLEILEDGDESEIGERGVRLHGVFTASASDLMHHQG